MKQSSRSFGSKRRSEEEKEAWALKAICNAMYAVGVTVTNVDEAEQALDLAARLLSYAINREVKPAEIRDRMLELLEEEIAEAEAEAEAASTKH